MAKFKLEGLDEVLDTLKYLEKLPQKCVNKAAKAGATVALNYAKNRMPKGNKIVLLGEKTKKDKRVFQTIFSRKNDNTNVRYTKNERQIMRESLINNKEQIEKTAVDVLAQEIDKIK